MRPVDHAAYPTELDGEEKKAKKRAENRDFVGRVLDDRYRVIEMLGEGGMGAVFVAEHLKLHKKVALKVIRAELAGNGEVAVRFAREAMATAQFEHPHVASAIDYGTLPEGGAYFVMQLVSGKSLARVLKEQKRLPWVRACEIAAQVADALSAAQEAGIVHRDLKPENILIEDRSDGSQLVRILDFGIAHVPKTDAPAPEGAMVSRELTKLGSVMGTPGYMAPEQAVGEPTDHRTDLYALGVVLWESIAGRPLWDEREITTLFTRQLGEVAPALKPASADATIPDALDRLVGSLLERSPKDRPERALAVRDQLREFARLSPGHSPPLQALINSFYYPLSSFRTVLFRWASRWRRQSPARRRAQLLGAAAGLIALLVVLFSVGGEENHQIERAAPQPTTLLDKTVQTLADSAKTVARVVKPQKPDFPLELKEAVETMRTGKRVRDRRAAAKKVLAYRPASALAKYIKNIATLEAAKGCRERAEAIGVLQQAGDKRTLPSLRYLSRMPKTGCGFLGLEDCYSCIRTDLREAIESIEDRVDQSIIGHGKSE
ncbi:MAG: serine/threonine protein kinase [Deltaproteobacteria bacterium]|nr:serine/threonine protein kinase [Deltaproteobacteria bacterium]